MSGRTCWPLSKPPSSPRGAAEKPSTELRRPCGPSPGSATALLAPACTMHSLRCSSLHPDLSHLDRRISRRRFSAAPLNGQDAEPSWWGSVNRNRRPAATPRRDAPEDGDVVRPGRAGCDPRPVVSGHEAKQGEGVSLLGRGRYPPLLDGA